MIAFLKRCVLFPLQVFAWLIAAGLLMAACTAYSDKPEVRHFIDKMVQQHHFDRQQLKQLLDTVRPNPMIIRLMNKPAESFTWPRYRKIFISEYRARKGALFWKKHQQTLAYAEKRYGVPAAIIVAILGVETRYGEITGKYRILDALSTLAFQPGGRRAAFFQSELEQFLLLSRDNQAINAHKTKGSYAGAMGQGQFMPSSYRRFAVDATHKGYSDLLNNPNDAILSVAHYLQAYGWSRGEPVIVPARAPTAIKQLPGKNASLKQFARCGIYPQTTSLANDLKANWVALPLENHQQEYWLGFHNFQVIMHYNTSTLYAMAVYQLSQEIQHYYQKESLYHAVKA